MRTAAVSLFAALLGTIPADVAAPADWMVRLTLAGQKIEGTPLAFSPTLVSLLGRDGRLWQFDPDEATAYQKTSDRFRGYSPSEFRAQLLRDLETGFEVSGTSHYLVAHPRGQRDRWAQRFEELYRSFVHYFSVRGLKPKPPPFSLVGVVCRDQREFARYAAGKGVSLSAGLLGYYSLQSNRIIVYDMQDRHELDDWHRTASAIVHEATHQTAFNTGVHSRWVPPPLWVAEGLATMFEAPGVYDSRHHTRQSDRINRARLRDFRRLVPHHQPELIASLVASDRPFRSNTGAAYAEAWALTFFLVETQPTKYVKYLALTAARRPFTKYTSAERTADFTSVFGDNWRMLEAQLLRYMAKVE